MSAMSSLFEHLINEAINFPKFKVIIPRLRPRKNRKYIFLHRLVLLYLVLMLHPLLPTLSMHMRYSLLLLPRWFRNHCLPYFSKSLLAKRTGVLSLNKVVNTLDHLLMQLKQKQCPHESNLVSFLTFDRQIAQPSLYERWFLSIAL